MFEKARLKLTGWYLLIIMLISITFSTAIYSVLTSELNRVERIQRLRQERRIPPQFHQERVPSIDNEVIIDSENRLIAILLLINLGILVVSAGAGYFLAGRTLNPIKEMIDEQARFITDASHELRTPLTSLKSEIEVNLRDKKLTLNTAKKLLESNLEEVNNLSYLSDNLIKLTQYQKGNGENLQDVNLSDICKEAIRKVTNIAKSKNITIINHIKNQSLIADKQSLIEMFVVFLDNAIKYSSSGKTVTIFAKKHDRFLQIEVKDQGFGIDKDDISHLFDRFYRADKSRAKKDVSGYGLGLSIAKQIIEKHHGSIKVISEINKGTTFLIFLPLS